MSYRNYPVDDNLLLKASAAVTSSAAGSLILDLGDALMEGTVVIDVSAIDTTSNDEQYEIVMQGSPDAAFGTAGNIVELCSITIGDNTPKRTDADGTDTTGRFLLNVRNERNGTVYRYFRLYTVVAGTTPTITYKAWLSKVRS